MPTRTKINGRYIDDPIKDYSNGTSPKSNKSSESALAKELTLIKAQRDSLINTLKGVGQCKNITQVRKVLEHGRQTYPLR